MRVLGAISAAIGGGMIVALLIVAGEGSTRAALPAAAGGALVILLAAVAAARLRTVPGRIVAGGGVGLVAGLVAAFFLAVIVPGPLRSVPAVSTGLVTLALALAYLGARVGAAKGEEFLLADLVAPFRPASDDGGNPKILDTSVVIDGRIADICETGFLEGTFIVPQFVLRELQYVADSPDPLKRNRGRRGLDVLQRMQKKTDLKIVISDQDFPKIREVDGKLIALAQKIKGTIITNDFNLNKVAELHGVPVLNINQLANALKPVVLPGELMRVTVIREGKEANQGVAYLDDGTMVVVDNARRFIGRTVEVIVTSVLQTTAGRMIFTQIKDAAGRETATTTEAAP